MVSTIRMVDFRCWDALALDVPECGGIFVGQNAQGKTSILEAVCVLLRLQSPRTHKLYAMIRFSQPGFGVAGDSWDMNRKVRVGMEGLRFPVHDEPRKHPAELSRTGRLVAWSGNEYLEFIRGDGE